MRRHPPTSPAACGGPHRYRLQSEPDLQRRNDLLGAFPSAGHQLLAEELGNQLSLVVEVGHHLDNTLGAAARNGEAAAESWNKRLMVSYFHKHYWYLIPLVGI